MVNNLVFRWPRPGPKPVFLMVLAAHGILT